MKLDDHIIFKNDALIAINKPAGLLTIPDRQGAASLKGALLQAFGSIYTVHRLDRDTSGIVIFAFTEAAHRELSMLFEGRTMEKYYLGLVHGKPAEEEGQIDQPIMEHPTIRGRMVINRKGKPSLTDYKVLDSFRGYSWVQFRIHTGRTHQIRLHMKSIGHPIVCDEMYGDGKPVFISALKKDYKLAKSQDDERPILSRLALHSAQLKFMLQDTSYDLQAEAPKDLRALLQQLRKLK